MKLCECGCGQQTTRVRMTNRKMGRVAGEYNRFIRGHNRKRGGGPDRPDRPEAVRVNAYDTDPETGCWNWNGTISRSLGYGIISFSGAYVYAHRFAYEVANRTRLTNRFQIIRHTCDNRRCVNPDHLVLGTQKDNMQDAVDRGRIARGTSHGKAKLNPDKVREIRRMRELGDSYRVIAERMGVSWRAIQDVATGVTWSHVED